MNQVAYGERDTKAIKKKERINFLYKAIRKIQRLIAGYEKKQIKEIITYPAINKENDLIEIVNKLAWSFPKKIDLSIDILVSDALLQYDLSKIENIPGQRNYLQTDISHIHLVTTFRQDVDLIFYIQAKEILKSNPFYLYKTELLDKNYFSLIEGNLLKESYFKTLSRNDREAVHNLSVQNYKQMIKEYNHKQKAYCFATGPSLDKYKDFEYEQDSLKVICNSIVKNDTFMEYIGKPDVLVFADPVFHFSPCEYSAVFRDEVVKVYKKYQPFIIVPLNTVALLLAHYPLLEDRIIGMERKRSFFNFPTPENLWIKISENILTLYMLPIASAISQEIDIIGADGRKANEKYFWQHSSSVQFDNLMKTVFETHPSFFRDRNYKDYYEEHCDFLEKLLQYGEAKEKKYYSLTESYIPALSKRKR